MSKTGKTLSSHEMYTLLDAVQHSQALRSPIGKRDRVMVLLMLQHGLRVSETVNLRVGDVRDGWVWVRNGKGGKDRKVEASSDLIEAVDAWVRERPAGESDRLLVSLPSMKQKKRGVSLSRKAVAHRLKVLQRRAGLRETGCHALRHTWVTHLLESGVSLDVVSKAAGHSSPLVTSRVYDGSWGVRGTAGVWD